MLQRIGSIALALAVLGAVTSPAAAQRKEYRFGVVGGVNFARLSGTGVVDAKTRTSVVAGLYSRSEIAPNVGFETQVLWSEQGAKGDIAPAIGGAIKLSYIKIPVLFTYAVPTGNGQVKPRFYLGPAVSFRTRCKVTATVLVVSTTADCSDLDLQLKKTDFSVQGGVGVDLGPVTLAARYDYGLTKLDDSGLGLDIKNRVFSLTAAYGFRIGR